MTIAPYAFYIWTAYGISAVVLGGLTVWCWAQWRRARARLKALEK